MSIVFSSSAVYKNEPVSAAVTSQMTVMSKAIRIGTQLAIGLVGLGLGLASQASRVYICNSNGYHTATGEAICMYSIYLFV